MISNNRQIKCFNKSIYLLIVYVFLPFLLFAEEPDTSLVNSAMAKYKNENAIYLNVNRHLIIDCINGKLVARTEVTLQKLMLTALAPSLYGREDLTYSFLSDLENMPTGNAYIPTGKGFKNLRCTNFGGYHPTDDGVFYDDKKGMAVIFNGLTKGSVTETKYTLHNSDVNMLPRLFFYQENLPIAKCTIEITVPEFVELGFTIEGANVLKIRHSEVEKNNNITYRFTAKDVPAQKMPVAIPSSLYFLPHVVPFIKSYMLPGHDMPKDVFNSADGLYDYMFKFIKNINISHDKELEKVTDNLVKNDATPRQKAAHIYDWVQKNLHYVAFEDSLGGYYPRQAGTVSERKFGDCKDMASILVAMFRRAGLKAYFTWIGTRHLPYATSETPVPLFDHMICTIKVDDDWIFVDGTNPVIPFGKYPDGDQGKDALIAIDADNYKLLRVPVANEAENTVNDSTIIHVLSNKSISGTVNLKYSGSMAQSLANIKLLAKDQQRDKIIRLMTSRGSNKYIISKYDFSIEPTGNRDATLNAEYNIHDYLQKVKGQYIINMNLNRYLADTYIDTTNRLVSYYFNNKEKIKETIILEIPKGSSVAFLPHPAQGNISNILSYKITYKVAGRNIILVKEYELKARSVNKKEFANYNKLIENLRKQYNESVVLSAH